MRTVDEQYRAIHEAFVVGDMTALYMKSRLLVAMATVLCGAVAAACAPTALRAQDAAASCAVLLEEAWRAVAEVYYDTDFGGVAWEDLRPSADEDCHPSTIHDDVRRLLARIGDPAVRLVPRENVAAFLAEMTGQPTVGPGLRELLSVDVDERTGLLTVVTPVPDGPAAEAGIRTGDVIEAIDGVRSDTMDLALAMARLRGPAGTTVEVRVGRAGAARAVRLARQRLEPPSRAALRFRTTPGGAQVAYVRVADFSTGTAAAVRDVLEEAVSQGVAAVLLDLRDNPGGLVEELVSTAELLLPPGTPIARLRSRPGADTVFTTAAGTTTTLPLLTLVNRGTASAAEALAGAIQASGRGMTVGERTFGKGLAHFATALSDGSLVLAPSGRLETPHGRDILEEGIAPDRLVASSPLATLVPDLDGDPAITAALAELDRIPRR